VRRLDGAYHWVEACGRVELDENGRAQRFPGMLLDISAWKHADEARTLLMREVDHRARNALAIVQSVVRLTDASDPVRYREEILGRVDAIARAQGSLARTNWEGAVLAEIVRDELTAYAAESRFTLNGPKITLPAQQVQTFEMIIHELVTNAVKYGALSVPSGTVAVAWRRQSVVVQFVWQERGGPPVTPPHRAGFGTHLIARLTRQMGVSPSMDWDKAGLTARLEWSMA
jgi:two-component sensor histidine kinase